MTRCAKALAVHWNHIFRRSATHPSLATQPTLHASPRMPFRPLKAKLREIKRNSRRVERDGFDRAQEIAFVLAAIIAPVAVMKLDTSYTR